MYLKDLLQRYKPARNLRSASKNLLLVPKFKLKTYGSRAFTVAAPTLWNNIPENIRQSPTFSTFKSRLKTSLFKTVFNTKVFIHLFCILYLTYILDIVVLLYTTTYSYFRNCK